MTYRRVTVGVSGSIASLAALRAALDLARGSGLRELHAVHVWALPVTEVGVHGATPESLQDWLRDADHRLTLAFEQALGGEPDDLVVRRHLVPGTPAEVLLRSVGPPDLLVVGASESGPFQRMLRGSVARRCLDRAPCQVLVVPPPELLAVTRRSLLGISSPV